LLNAEEGAVISRYAVFIPVDEVAVLWSVTVRTGAVVGPFAVLHGGACVGEQARVGEHAVVSKPELGPSGQAPVRSRQWVPGWFVPVRPCTRTWWSA
jgi:bifunctional N-acetylglucosamine-1-phosphate-uridyltransferase/glucosamine-1-phosphate-acetyltransferase GlmU-like protein